MSGGLPKRTTWADDTDSDIDEVAPTPASAPPKKDGWWESDTDSEVDNTIPASEKKRDTFWESESDSEESEEEDEDEEDEDGRAGQGRGGEARDGSEDDEEKSADEARRMRENNGGVPEVEGAAGTSAPAVTGNDPSQTQNLSKKERKALKQKQLDDLDALLGEFGVDVAPPTGMEEQAVPAPTNGGSAPVAPPAEVGMKGEGGDAAKKSKKKKKKEKRDADGSKGQAAPAPAAHEEAPVVVVQPITAALKNKTKKKSTPVVAKPRDAVLKAMKEAAEKEAKKKKKKDKKNFNQAPPGK